MKIIALSLFLLGAMAPCGALAAPVLPADPKAICHDKALFDHDFELDEHFGGVALVTQMPLVEQWLKVCVRWTNGGDFSTNLVRFNHVIVVHRVPGAIGTQFPIPNNNAIDPGQISPSYVFCNPGPNRSLIIDGTAGGSSVAAGLCGSQTNYNPKAFYLPADTLDWYGFVLLR